MDSLFSILLIVGLVLLGSSNKKKKAKKAAVQRKNAYAEANESIRQAQQKMPLSKQDWMDFVMEQAQSAPRSKAQSQIKLNKSAPKANASKKLAQKKSVPEVKSAPIPAQPHVEGSVSTQGESAAEHTAHMARIHAEEQKREQAEKSLRQIRDLNRQKLRSAVVMSEVLGKPVSLRPNRFR